MGSQSPGDCEHGDVCDDTRGEWNRLTYPDRACPAQLVRPHGDPAERRIAAFDDRRAQVYPASGVSRSAAKLIVVGQMVGDRLESTNSVQPGPRDAHGCAESEILGFEAAGLQDLAPEVGIGRHGLPLHSGSSGGGKAVETAHHPNLRFGEARCDFGQMSWGNPDIGIADDENWMEGVTGQLDESRDLTIYPQVFGTYHQLGVDTRKLGDEIAH